MNTIFKILILLCFSVANVFAGGPIANDDNFVLQITSESIALNVLLNDDLVGQEDVSVRIISGPAVGDIEVDQKTNNILFFISGNFDGEIDFVYEVCGTSADCGTVCSQASGAVKVIRMPVVPEGLTPNGDGLNDRFFFNGARGFERFELTVVNRWGDMVYQNKDYQSRGFQESDLWDGTFNDESLPQGAYYYYINVFKNGEMVGDPLTGVVHIFR